MARESESENWPDQTMYSMELNFIEENKNFGAKKGSRNETFLFLLVLFRCQNEWLSEHDKNDHVGGEWKYSTKESLREVK